MGAESETASSAGPCPYTLLIVVVLCIVLNVIVSTSELWAQHVKQPLVLDPAPDAGSAAMYLNGKPRMCL